MFGELICWLDIMLNIIRETWLIFKIKVVKDTKIPTRQPVKLRCAFFWSVLLVPVMVAGAG